MKIPLQSVRKVLSMKQRRLLFSKFGNMFGRKTMYHVTPNERVSEIMHEGLKSSAKANWREGWDSKTPGVFVGNLRTTRIMRELGYPESEMQAKLFGGTPTTNLSKTHTLFKVKIKKNKLLPDPDYGREVPVSASARVLGNIPRKNITKTSFKYEYGKRGVIAGGVVGSTVGGGALIKNRNNKKQNKIRRVK